jgi:hypothetical protein
LNVFGAWLAEPVLEIQVALTMVSSIPHIADRDTLPSEDDLTTRNWGGGETPFSPFFPAGPGGPCGPGGPAGPAGPGSPFSPLSPLSPLGPEQPASANATASPQTTVNDLRIQNPPVSTVP